MLADKYLWSITKKISNTSENCNSDSKKSDFMRIIIFRPLWLSFKFYIPFYHLSKLNIRRRKEILHSYNVSSLGI